MDELAELAIATGDLEAMALVGELAAMPDCPYQPEEHYKKP